MFNCSEFAVLHSQDEDLSSSFCGATINYLGCNRTRRSQCVLRTIGYGETVGSGFPTIISAWKEAHWGEPELKNTFEIDEVELVLPIPNKGSRDASDTINDNVRATYTIIRLNPGIQRKGIADISGRSVAAIGRHLAILMKEGLIEHRDSNKTGGYFVK